MTSPTLPPEEGFNEKDHHEEIDLAEVHASILREQADPKEGGEPIPLWLLTIFFAIVFWAGLYLANNSGGFRADVFDPSQAVQVAGGDSGPVDPKVLGKRVFTQSCVVCHQPTGLGLPGVFPPLAGSEWVLGTDPHGDNHLVKLVLKGMQGPVKVKDVDYNNAMPAWTQLSDEQIAGVLTYIRSEWGNAAPPISTEYVKSIREKTADRTDPWTAKELLDIPAEKVPASESAPSAPPAAPPAPPAT